MKHLNRFLFVILTLAMLAACAGPLSPTDTPGSGQTQPPSPSNTPGTAKTQLPSPTITPGIGQNQPITVAISNKPRNNNPVSPASDQSQLADGNTAFAFDLYQQLLSGQAGNLFYSPYSISVALSMAQAGAKGQTLSQIDQVMHYTLQGTSLYQAFNALQLALSNEQKNQGNPSENDFTLNVVNAAWGQDGYKFLQAYLDILAENYGAGLRLVDFLANPDAARQTINDWVTQQTAQKIKDLIPQGAITPLSRLVLTNAIYFNSPWLSPFNESSTKDGSFTNLDGKQVTVPMMNMMHTFGYFQGSGYQAVELPYSGDKLSMLVLVPDSGQFPAVEKSLSPALLETIRNGLQGSEVKLSMPRFKYESSVSLAEILKKMGMTDAFDPNQADLSGMDGTRNLFISDVLHKAYVSVDEKGTEAAAATAVVIGTTAMPTNVVTLKIDRPFIFLIQDNQSGSVLFMGRVAALGQA